MHDENFKKFLGNPDVKSLMEDKEFQQAVKSKNYLKLVSNQKLLKLMQDQEIQQALSNIDINKYN